MATTKQAKALQKLVELGGNLDDTTKGEILMMSGYSKNTAKTPNKVFKSKGWLEILNEIDDEFLIDELKKLAKDDGDKRPKIQAIDMLLKLKDKYPANKYKIDNISNEWQGLFAKKEETLDNDAL